jgi:hypothetical protein
VKAGKRILLAMVTVTVLGAATLLAAGHFRLREAFAASAIGIVIGMGVALGFVSPTPTEKMRLKARKGSLARS